MFSKWQNLKLRTTVPLSYNARAMATDEDTLNRYYDMLEDSLTVNELFDKPANLFNCDEMELPQSPKSFFKSGEFCWFEHKLHNWQ